MYYFPSAALSSGVSSLSECDSAGVVVLLASLVALFFSFCSGCAGCPARISFAISCTVSFPCSCPSVAESLRWVDAATAEMMAAMAAPGN
jgi:cytosine/uracil/thiamine/allantoin permease